MSEIQNTDDRNDWRAILKSSPEAQKGRYNLDRKNLLREGVYLDLSRSAAESWIPALKLQRETAEKISRAQGNLATNSNDVVRVTIVQIPPDTKVDPIDGKILVEADGLQAKIYSSLIYNSILGKDICPDFVVTNVSLMGHGDTAPTRGEGSHSTFNRSRNQ